MGNQFMAFPVFRTTLEVLEFCWRERRLALHFGWLPLVIAIAIAFIYQAVLGMSVLSAPVEPTLDTQTTLVPLLLSLIQMAIFLPLSVTWLRLVVLGEEEARRRPIITFGTPERRFFGWQISCFLGALAAVTIGAGITLFLQALANDRDFFGDTVKTIVAVVAIAWTCFWVIGILLALMRVTLVFVFAALDRPVTFREAWAMTKGLSWHLLGGTFLLGLASMAASLLFKLVGFILSGITAIGAGTEISPIMLAMSTIGSGLTNLIFWITAATLYGVVYNMLMKEAASVSATPP